MTGIKTKRYFQENLGDLIPNKDLLEPALLKNFITYWWVRKSHPFLSSFELQELKASPSSIWIKIIESNHTFRTVYGDKKADEIIKLIEKKTSSYKL